MSSPNEADSPAPVPDPPTAVPTAAQTDTVSVSPAEPRRRLSRPRSLRFELMVSYLSLLSVVVIGFGGSIYALVRQATYRAAESDLLGSAQMLAREMGRVAPETLSLSSASRHRFGPAPRDHAYFAVWNSKGELVAGLDHLPPHLKHIFPRGLNPSQPPPQDHSHRPYYSVANGNHLDVILRTPEGAHVLVGRHLAREYDHLNQLLVRVTLFGLVSLAAGAAGTWWLARRIVEPLDRLTQTAETITERSLEQRLELTGASSELTRLSTVFNTMLDRLQAAFQRQIRLTADASHELRTPVAVILSQTEHTLSRPRTPDEYCSALETCLRAARRMKRLVDDLLLLARADSGRLELRQEPLDLADVVRQSLALLEPVALEKQVRISSQLQTTLTRGDPARLGQVVTNLVTNALLYNRPQGEVFVTVQTRDAQALLMVSDTGVGIAAADLPRLFERFYRADQSRTHSSGQGTGLGLSIVSEIVSAHHGSINVTSELEVGTTVTVLLPIFTEAADGP